MGHQRELAGQASADRMRGIVEDDHQCVTLRGDLDASVTLEGLGQEAAVGFEQSDIFIASFAEEPGRALDVRHEERDNASRQSKRRRVPAPRSGLCGSARRNDGPHQKPTHTVSVRRQRHARQVKRIPTSASRRRLTQWRAATREGSGSIIPLACSATNSVMK